MRIVSNAGGLNPAGLADKVREVAKGLGLDVAVAHVEGDDVRALGEWPDALTANAYLGGFGIAAALRGGADVVVTGRVTDASLVVGAGVAEFGWDPTSYDELAGAVVAGHVLECGAQATGGNFSGFRSLVSATPRKPLGFPIAELAADGSSVITKHDGTGGAVTVDTVTAQLLYEIQSTRYLGPDVTTLLDTIQLEQDGPDRVAVTGVRGEAPPARLKVWRQRARRLPQHGRVRPHRPRDRREGRLGARADGGCLRRLGGGARLGDLVADVGPAPRRRHRGGRVLPVAVRGQGPLGPNRSASRSPPPRSSSRWRRTPASR